MTFSPGTESKALIPLPGRRISTEHVYSDLSAPLALVKDTSTSAMGAILQQPMGTGALFPGVTWQGGEADYSPPTSAEVKKMWFYTATPQYIFMAYCLVT
jgi:hypothetical protein